MHEFIPDASSNTRSLLYSSNHFPFWSSGGLYISHNIFCFFRTVIFTSIFILLVCFLEDRIIFYLVLIYLFIHLYSYYCTSFYPKATKVISFFGNLTRLRSCNQLLSVSCCWGLSQGREFWWQTVHIRATTDGDPLMLCTECLLPSILNLTCWNPGVLVIRFGTFGRQLSQEGGGLLNGISTLGLLSAAWESVRWRPRNQDTDFHTEDLLVTRLWDA